MIRKICILSMMVLLTSCNFSDSLHNHIGVNAIKSGNYEKAISEFEKIDKYTDKYIINYSYALINKGDLSKALDMVSKVEKKNIKVYELKSRAYRLMGDVKSVEEIAKEALENGIKSDKIFMDLSFAKDNLQSALIELDKVENKSIEYYLTRASIYYKFDEFDRAFKEISNVNDENFDIIKYKYDILVKINVDESNKYLESLLSKKLKDEDKAKIYALLSKKQEAISIVEDLNDKELFATINYLLYDFEETTKVIKEMFKDNPELNLELYLMLIDSLMIIGEYDEADFYIKNARYYHDDNVQILKQELNVAENTGNIQKSIAVTNKLIELTNAKRFFDEYDFLVR